MGGYIGSVSEITLGRVDSDVGVLEFREDAILMEVRQCGERVKCVVGMLR